MKHLTEKEIYSVLVETADKNLLQKAKDHQKICAECNKKISILSDAISEDTGFFTGPKPPESLKNSIINTWHLKSGKIDSTDSGLFYKLQLKSRINNLSGLFNWKYIIPVFFTCIIIFSVIFIPQYKPENSSKGQFNQKSEPAITITDISTGAKKNVSIQKNNEITIKSNDFATLEIYPDLVMAIFPDSLLSFPENKNFSGINLNLKNGMLLSRSDGGTDPVINCKEYSISPLGTEFIVYKSKEVLITAVKEGSVLIINNKNSKELKLLSGRIWSSKNPEKTFACTNSTLNLFTKEISSDILFTAGNILKQNTENLKAVETGNSVKEQSLPEKERTEGSNNSITERMKTGILNTGKGNTDRTDRQHKRNRK